MTDRTSWYSWFSFPFFAPLSGAVTQDIGTVPYKGAPEIETAVIRDAASFGRQLGILSDAVLELARHLEREGEPLLPALATAEMAGTGTSETALGKLHALVEQIKTIKSSYQDPAWRQARQALEALKEVDPEGPEKLVAQMRR